MLGHYATGQALVGAGVVSAGDMTLEAAACKVAYLMGRGDLTLKETANMMGYPLRGEGKSSQQCDLLRMVAFWACIRLTVIFYYSYTTGGTASATIGKCVRKSCSKGQVWHVNNMLTVE
jgi:hypothetical protein